MTKILTAVMTAALLLGAPQIASASCIGDAAATRQECMSSGPRDRAAMAACSAYYRDDLAECHRFAHADMPETPMHRPPPPPPHR
jgi:hypothetical protein